MKFREIIFLLLISIYSAVVGGDKKVYSHIKGTILDQNTGEPLPGVTLTDALTGRTVYTDFDGHFSFDFYDREAHTLEISYISYEEKKVIISSSEKDYSVTIHLSGLTVF